MPPNGIVNINVQQINHSYELTVITTVAFWNSNSKGSLKPVFTLSILLIMEKVENLLES